ncbi:hypothetical protein FRC12_020834 [Ceratobasidium sp. 428]|nr:hypothetical protein FRC12_020834 [Ceratobasidium sp. 428]
MALENQPTAAAAAAAVEPTGLRAFALAFSDLVRPKLQGPALGSGVTDGPAPSGDQSGVAVLKGPNSPVQQSEGITQKETTCRVRPRSLVFQGSAPRPLGDEAPEGSQHVPKHSTLSSFKKSTHSASRGIAQSIEDRPAISSPPPSPSAENQPSATGRSPILKSFAGQDLTKPIAPPVPIAILNVSVGNIDNLPGPHHDRKWVSAAFSPAIFFELHGNSATIGKVRLAVEQLFQRTESVKVVAIVLWFNGHSRSEDNEFELNENETVNENMVLGWVNEFRKLTGGHLPVFIAFDFCRKSPVPRVLNQRLDNIYIIWGCDLGQSSYDIKLGDTLPYSHLVKIICLVLHKLESCAPDASRGVMSMVATEASRIIKIHRAAECGRLKCDVPWNACTCSECGEGGVCPHQKHFREPNDDSFVRVLQNPVALFSGSPVDLAIESVREYIQPILVDRVKERVKHVADEVEKYYRKWVAPHEPPNSGAGGFQPIRSSVPRGAKVSVATPGPLLASHSSASKSNPFSKL